MRNNLWNFSTTPFEICSYKISINQTLENNNDNILGINCFDELLLESDLISYARHNLKK